MQQTLKTITSKQLLEFLPTYPGSVLNTFSKLPQHFAAKQEGENTSLRREFLYHDFKEAWSHFQLFSTACYKLGYRPAIFNVYNKIIVECFSINEKGAKQVTTKDLFVAYLLNELAGNQSESAYRKAL